MRMQPAEATTEPRWASRPIVLVGLMGSGKTTVGRRLAARLGWPFADADEEIERAAGMTIREMWDRHGEPAFRDGERRVVARLLERGRAVIATGGGAFIQPETRELVLERATAIWLDADVAVLAARVARRSTRPLLVGRDPKQVLAALALERNPCYAQAHARVASVNSAHERTVDSILQALEALP
jgi:shikimate kinase